MPASGLPPKTWRHSVVANVANVTIVPALAPDQRVTVTMSLSGFTAAFDEITELEEQRP